MDGSLRSGLCEIAILPSSVSLTWAFCPLRFKIGAIVSRGAIPEDQNRLWNLRFGSKRLMGIWSAIFALGLHIWSAYLGQLNAYLGHLNLGWTVFKITRLGIQQLLLQRPHCFRTRETGTGTTEQFGLVGPISVFSFQVVLK